MHMFSELEKILIHSEKNSHDLDDEDNFLSDNFENQKRHVSATYFSSLMESFADIKEEVNTLVGGTRSYLRGDTTGSQTEIINI